MHYNISAIIMRNKFLCCPASKTMQPWTTRNAYSLFWGYLMFKIVILLWLWQQMVASGPSDGDFSNIGNVTSNVVVQLQFDDSEHADIVANKHGYKNMGKAS
ncbi:conserved hypothetical protein [Trichinella spiralis]|uniref:hypothetical protein n=1 Tax=Trichinella spiralis TaxID=6334 RepID=UPI0001EFC17B|nr:conserved hypothetical protein [Trichinella spiralis]